MTFFGKNLIFLGIVFIVAGLIMVIMPKIPFFGKLPGDVHIKKDNFEIYVPVVTSIILSLMLSGIFWLISLFGKK